MKTNELSGAALDWAVAKCEFPELVWGETIGLSAHARDLIVIPDRKAPDCYWQPSTNWAQGGKIIERERICLEDAAGMYWTAALVHEDKEYGGVKRAEEQGTTPLVAAMRCYVASKMGDEVQLPAGLI